MPYKCQYDKMKIPNEYDRRCKLIESQRQEIRDLYGLISQRKLASLYGVSRRLIQFIGDPKKKERELELRKMRGGSKIYYNKEKWKHIMREHRQYKKKLYDEGKLLEKR